MVESTRGVSFHPIRSLGGLPRDVLLILSASMFVLMDFNAFGTRLQFLWVMFFMVVLCCKNQLKRISNSNDKLN